MLDRKLNIVVMILMLLSLFSILGYKTIGHSEIKIYNPFGVDIGVRQKCNWDGKAWEINRKFDLDGKTNIVLKVPNNSQCQIWPHR